MSAIERLAELRAEGMSLEEAAKVVRQEQADRPPPELTEENRAELRRFVELYLPRALRRPVEDLSDVLDAAADAEMDLPAEVSAAHEALSTALDAVDREREVS